MNSQQWVDIIYHQATLRMQEKGLLFSGISQKEQYQLMYEISLELLCELGDNNDQEKKSSKDKSCKINLLH